MYKIDIGEFDGRSWEELIQRCLKDKYEEEYYQMMPNVVHGDHGIEGLTVKTGKVFQCYCPDSQCETKELTQNQQTKINKDLKKLEKYKVGLEEVLGKQKISEWHFITPEYKDKSLIKYCRKKEEEFRAKNLSHLDKNFTVLIKDYRDFAVELERQIFLMKNKIDISISNPDRADWDKCESEHIKNLKRKLNSLLDTKDLSEEEQQKRVKKIMDNYIMFYQRGIKVMNILEFSYSSQFDKLNRIKNSQGENIAMESLMTTLSKDKLFKKANEDLEKALNEGLGDYFEITSLEQLSKRIIAEWLMYCPLDFGD
ncbi:MAG: hypothetical protein N4A40_07000 [Tissierellales bacterium]|jgi:hypothetical protein|nr:hypothetical protein [Tissierellales bacterium]